ncbi:hypothetical protein BAUCODRAFT_32606 [Baudoinia panamericana UAMH 10762]|uniref:Tim44-like domain-containing protein n=1 Tax=Baudoinia panamericana (strain UAMH 10762) TaxID=717646 RepID=M2NGX1_BAUPA|nr:uncharacterized protein BAUCODRAFT_32606 [Baudoinia panamericana UAMH 10762]EMC98549.1 hypothetical protein BAUCODRAFT_32606 [Baudoinia panamericana UAMH 10762]
MSRPATRSLASWQQYHAIFTQQCLRGPRNRFASKSLRLPSHPSHHGTRPFSGSASWHAGQMGKAFMPSAGRRPQQSMKVQKAKAERDAKRQGIGFDIGLIPETFVMPRGKNLPSWFSNSKDRRKLEWARLKLRLKEFYSAVFYRFFSIRPNPRLEWRKLPGIAKELHKEMYEHFAQGNVAAIEGKLADGIYGSLQKRIGLRPANTAMRWRLHKYLSRPRTVSYKATLLPPATAVSKYERNAMVQAVVRIHSLQSLQRVQRVSERNERGQLRVRDVVLDSQGREVPETELELMPKDAKESVEYVVVQKFHRAGKEGNWELWGTTEETTLERLESDQKALQDAVKAQSAARRLAAA